MSEQERWQVNCSAPEAYERYMVPTLFAPWANDLLTRAAPQSGDRVVDVACGTGIVARLAATNTAKPPPTASKSTFIGPSARGCLPETAFTAGVRIS